MHKPLHSKLVGVNSKFQENIISKNTPVYRTFLFESIKMA